MPLEKNRPDALVPRRSMAPNQGHCSECDPLTECSEEEQKKEAPQDRCGGWEKCSVFLDRTAAEETLRSHAGR